MKRTRKRIILALSAAGIAAMLVTAGYALSSIMSLNFRIANGSIVNSGATMKGTTITATAARLGTPTHRVAISGGTTPTAAKNWQQYE